MKAFVVRALITTAAMPAAAVAPTPSVCPSSTADRQPIRVRVATRAGEHNCGGDRHVQREHHDDRDQRRAEVSRGVAELSGQVCVIAPTSRRRRTRSRSRGRSRSVRGARTGEAGQGVGAGRRRRPRSSTPARRRRRARPGSGSIFSPARLAGRRPAHRHPRFPRAQRVRARARPSDGARAPRTARLSNSTNPAEDSVASAAPRSRANVAISSLSLCARHERREPASIQRTRGRVERRTGEPERGGRPPDRFSIDPRQGTRCSPTGRRRRTRR